MATIISAVVAVVWYLESTQKLPKATRLFQRIWRSIPRRKFIGGWVMFFVGTLWIVLDWTGRLRELQPVVSIASQMLLKVNPLWYQLALIFGGLGWIVYAASRPERPQLTSAERPAVVIRPPVLFPSQGFLWELTHNFWPQARAFAAEDVYIHQGGNDRAALSKCRMQGGRERRRRGVQTEMPSVPDGVRTGGRNSSREQTGHYVRR